MGLGSLAATLLACGAPGTAKPTTTSQTAAPQKSPELGRLMRTKMNAAYSQLVFLVFHAEGEPDYAKIDEHTGQLREAVENVMSLTPPPVVQSEEARSVYMTYNETLRRDSARFAQSVALKNRDDMGALLTKVGETCNACHHFFRIEIEDAPTK